MKNVTAKAAAAMAFGLLASVPACAQTTIPVGAPSYTSASFSRGDSNHMLLIISAVVFVIGIADNDSTLTVLGGVGVILSLSNSGQMFRYHDVLRTGPASFGVTSFAPQPFADTRPSPYLQVSFKF